MALVDLCSKDSNPSQTNKALSAVSSLILLFLLVASRSYSPLEGLYLDRVTLWSSASPLKGPTPPGYNTSITWRQQLSGVVDSSLTIYQFRISPWALLSFDVDLLDVNVTGGVIRFSPWGSGSGITTVSFSVLIVTEVKDYFELVTATHSPGTLLSEAGGWYYKYFNVNPTRLVYQAGNSLTFSEFKSFRYQELNPHSLQVAQISRFPSNTSFQLSLKIRCLRPDNLMQITVTVMFLKPRSASPNIAYFSKGTYYGSFYSSTNLIPDFGIPVNRFGSPATGYNCYHGAIYFVLVLSSGSIFNQFQISGATITTVNYQNIHSLISSTDCIVQCLPSYFVYLVNFDCVRCSDYLPYCTSCLTSTNCTQCEQGAFLISTNQSCALCQLYIPNCRRCLSSSHCTQCQSTTFPNQNNQICSLCSLYLPDCRQCSNISFCNNCYIGFSVVGGCTLVKGCIQVVPYSTPDGLKGICLACDPAEYTYDPVHRNCSCKAGFFAGDHCTNISGCIATDKINGSVKCIFCNSYQNFYLNSLTGICACIQGFQLVNGACADICGDGIVHTSACDDGNKQDGDGCSSSCKVEILHRCDTLSPSVCQYYSLVAITLIDTRKTPQLNQGVFTFRFSPKMPLLNRYNFSDYFILNFEDALYKVEGWSYNDGIAKVVVNFQTDLEGRQASANFSFNQLFIRHDPIIIQFTVRSNGLKLVIADQSTISLINKYLLLSITGLAIFLLLVGSWFQKMVGAEIVNSLQLVYYLHFTSESYTKAISQFLEMSPLGLSDLFLFGDTQNIIAYGDYSGISFEYLKAEFTLLIAASLLAFLSGISIFFSIFVPKLNSMMLKNYLFVLSLSLLCPVFLISLSMMVRLQRWGQQSYVPLTIRSLLMLSMFALMASIISSNCIKYIFQPAEQRQLDEKQRQLDAEPKLNYCIWFTAYLFMQVICLVLWLRNNAVWSSYCLLALSALKFSHYIYMKPYQTILQNLYIVGNTFTVIAFQVFLLLRRTLLLQSSDLSDNFCILLLACLMASCLIMGFFITGRAISKAIIRCLDRRKAYSALLQSKEAEQAQNKKETSIEYKHLMREVRRQLDNHGGDGMIQQLLNRSNLQKEAQESEELTKLKSRMIGKLREQKQKRPKRLLGK